jgi:DNA-binding NarL/FixJ family response regulator
LRLWLIEDNDELRGSLGLALASLPGVTLTGSFGRPSECLAAADRREHCDAAFVDLGLPEMSGEALIAELSRRMPDAALVALTVRCDDQSLFAALEAGAVGYLMKDTPLAELESALSLVRAGGSPLSPGIGRRVVRSLGGREHRIRDFGLTHRETEALELLCSGRSYREVAQAMGIAESTVQTHVKSIYEKLGVSSKAEAVRVALEAGGLPRRSQ